MTEAVETNGPRVGPGSASVLGAVRKSSEATAIQGQRVGVALAFLAEFRDPIGGLARIDHAEQARRIEILILA